MKRYNIAASVVSDIKAYYTPYTQGEAIPRNDYFIELVQF